MTGYLLSKAWARQRYGCWVKWRQTLCHSESEQHNTGGNESYDSVGTPTFHDRLGDCIVYVFLRHIRLEHFIVHVDFSLKTTKSQYYVQSHVVRLGDFVRSFKAWKWSDWWVDDARLLRWSRRKETWGWTCCQPSPHSGWEVALGTWPWPSKHCPHCHRPSVSHSCCFSICQSVSTATKTWLH